MYYVLKCSNEEEYYQIAKEIKQIQVCVRLLF